MVLVELETSTLAVLVAGMYCTENQVDSVAIPQSVWLSIAEKLEYFIGNGLWDFNKMSFEEWIRTGLFIFPKPLLEEEVIKEMMDKPLYWEAGNGNVILSISMDVSEINGGD